MRALVVDAETANGRNAQGATLLMMAAQHGSPALVEYLLEKGADPKAANPLGATALHWIGGEAEAYARKVELLLRHGADANAASNLGRTPLTIAAAHAGNAAALKLLLAKGADPKRVDLNGDGPLGNAATVADLEMMRLLIEEGANINERGIRGPAMRGLSPLMRASMSGCISCVRLLLAKGANVNAVSDPPRVVKAGLQDVGELTALLLAVQFNEFEIAKTIVEAGANLEAADARGVTPLLMATLHESQDSRIAKFLLARGAKTDVHSKLGESVADWAAKWKASPKRTDIETPETIPTPALAVSRSLALLLPSNDRFFAKSGCPGCHHQIASGLLAGLAKRRGVRFDAELAAKQLATVLTVSQPLRESSMQRVPTGGAPYGNSILLESWAAQGVEASLLTDALVHDIAGMQMADGSWLGMTQRPPVQYSRVTETAMAIRSLRDYGSPGRKLEFERRIARARRWLESAPTPYTEDVVMRSLGVYWAGGPADHAGILRLQREGGGFAQRPDSAPDAFATARALNALAQSGFDTGHEAFRRGVQYLLRTQASDGSWYVPSRSLKFQPYFESGFPYGHDQWISANATAWAAAALTWTLPQESSHASVPTHSAPKPAPLR